MRSHEQMEARKARLRQRVDGAIAALRQGKLIVAPRDANGIAAPAELRNATSEPRSVLEHGSCRGQTINVLPIQISNFLLAMDACMARVDYAQVAVSKNRCLQVGRPRHAVACRSLGVDGHLTPTQFCCYKSISYRWFSRHGRCA